MPPAIPAIGATVLGGTVVSGAVAPIVSAISSMTDKGPDLPQMPEAPKPEDAAKTASAKVDAKRRAIARSQSFFTSALGTTTEAEVARKSLLGQ